MISINYDHLLVDGEFTQTSRDAQIKGADEARLLFFSVEIVPFEEDPNRKLMNLQGEMKTGELRNREEIAQFLLSKGFIHDTILVTRDDKIYASHTNISFEELRIITLQIIHYQSTGTWSDD
ncbi:hypothetical protein [Shewanella algae]|uniref:hypothetical protein n=1 Tax=Shewanella algae TaxID=38313 RepID=UPI0004690DB7|nr:hypothetical protein [Shewanella algae]MBO2687487.1 hypothetical protein [Shewanella algae]NKZ43098.1 hypothetical protein [Shewanella algae]QTE79572.1 hypothetical protein E1N14_008150 [Shewanella algae]